MAIHPDTSIGAVQLTVADVDRMHEFYEKAIGLRDKSVVELIENRDAPPPPPRSTGLFHLAILVPTRADLARSLRRVADAGVSFTGASDHLVSEALYLRDPEGNGIEIYRDRPREEWRYVDGELQMATLPLDLEGLLKEPADGGADPGMRIGHVHLKVADLEAAEDFYAGVLGFDVTVRGYPGALFLSAGGYHHHIGLNTWESAGAPPPPRDARGLRAFEVVVPGTDELARVSERIEAAGLDAERQNGGVLVADPSGNRVLLSA
jgi:catechol 2,3-dioxygenase